MTQIAGIAGPDWLLPLVISPFVGSFVGVLVHRLPAGKGVVAGRSACPHCRRRLAPRDLVPLLSWALARGRCRFCGARLGLFYPGVEAAAMVVAAWAATLVSGWLLWASCLLGWALLALALIDLRHFLLPDRLTLPLAAAGLVVAGLVDPARVGPHAVGAALGFAVFWLVGRFYRRVRGREGLGLGDAKLLAAAGAWVSWTGLASVVVLAGGAALAVSLVLAGRGGHALSWSKAVPFGAYLCLGIWLVWLYGPLVVDLPPLR